MPDPQPRPPSILSLLTGGRYQEPPVKTGPLEPQAPAVPEAQDWLLTLGDVVRGALGFDALSPVNRQANLGAQFVTAAVPLVRGAKGAVTAAEEVPSLGRLIKTYLADTTIEDPVRHFGGAFPRVVKPGEVVDARMVRAGVPNESSIGASLTDYETLPGIREVPVSAFGDLGPVPTTGRVDELRHTQQLTEAIRQSGEISPLIVAVDREGPYILEGGHRFDALRHLGAKSFPAKVVLDLEDLNASPK